MASPSTKYVKIPSKHLPEPFQGQGQGDFMTKNIHFRAFLLISDEKGKKQGSIVYLNKRKNGKLDFIYVLSYT